MASFQDLQAMGRCKRLGRISREKSQMRKLIAMAESMSDGKVTLAALKSARDITDNDVAYFQARQSLGI